MATLKTISVRVKSLESTKKITQSMKMVAASKFARAEHVFMRMKALLRVTRIFLEKTKIKLDMHLPNQLIIYVASDRGLCGSAHSGLFRKLRDDMQGSKANFKIVCFGIKGRNLMRPMFKDRILFVVSEAGKQAPIFSDASLIVDYLVKKGFSYDTGQISFNKYAAKMRIEPSYIPIMHYNIIKVSPMRFSYQDISDDELRSFSEFFLAMQIFGALVENFTSVQCARMMAMDGSSKSAADVIANLKLTYNRTRQAAITKELSEIISGKLALENIDK